MRIAKFFKHKSKKSRRSKRTKKSRRSKRTKRTSGQRTSGRTSKFGFPGDGRGGMGVGYNGQTSFSNGYANYFGAKEPFINASEWWYANPGGSSGLPVTNKPTYYQSPDMIYQY